MNKSRSLPLLASSRLSSDLDFSLKSCKRLYLFILSCFIINIHRSRYIGVSHYFLNDLQIGFVLAKTGTECVP